MDKSFTKDDEKISAEVRRVGDILRDALAGEGVSLRLPTYQRPYKWSVKSARTLLDDLLGASERGGEYRIGSVILHENVSEGTLDIVDGQQRIVTLALIALALGMPEEKRRVAEVLKFGASDTVSPVRIRENFRAIAERLRSVSEKERKKLRGLIRSCEGDACATVVVICVKELSAAFRLFDSQNSRGKKVSPPALLKAYHLRAMSGTEEKELRDRVKKWEGVSPRDIDLLFEGRLYPVLLWTRKEDARRFTEKDIDEFKGYEDGCAYPCAERAAEASPHFLMTEPFRAGADFFAFTEKYLGLKEKAKSKAESAAREVIKKCIRECTNKPVVRQTECAISAENGDYADKTADKLSSLEARLFGGKGSAGLGHALELFYSAVMCYLDKFGETDFTAVAGKLFKWAMIPRISKQRLSAASVNKYVTETGVNVFALTAGARLHSEVRDVVTEVPDDKDITGSLAEEERKPLAALLRFMSEGAYAASARRETEVRCESARWE